LGYGILGGCTPLSVQVIDLPSINAFTELDDLRGEVAKLKDQLFHTQAYNRLVLDSATDYAVITADASGRITDWSEGAHRIMGWTKAEMLGQSLHRFFTPEDCESGTPEREIGLAVNQGRADDDRWHLKADGGRFFASGVMMPMFRESNLIGVVKILRDVTAKIQAADRERRHLKQLETQFQQLAEAIPQLVWISDSKGHDLYFNPKWNEFTGMSAMELNGHAWHEFIPSLETRQRVAQHRASCIADQSSWEDTFQMRDSQGKDSWFLCRALPIRNEAGEIIRWFSTCTDVEAMHRASGQYEQEAVDLRASAVLREQALDASQVDLKMVSQGRAAAEDQVRQLQKMEAVGQLTGGIAHDFNNMLTVIVGGLHLLQSRLARQDHDVEKFIDLALDGTTRAAQLTHRLLAFARQQPLSPEPVDLNRLVTGLSDMLQRTLGSNIHLEFVRHAGLWPIYADFSSLEQVLLNLSVNARDAMSEGGRITVETGNVYVDDAYGQQEQITPGQYVMVAVSDTGTGMSHELLARVFEPYFTTKNIGKGTGLGLAQVYGFAKQSHGHVKLYSELGHGTSVKLYLPRYTGSSEPTERMVVHEQLIPEALAGEWILVVEDDPKVKVISIQLLQELGYQVLAADSGEAALKIIADHPEITLLFTDVVMPGMTGRQLADRVTHDNPSMPVLYTTGYTRNAIVHNEMLDRGVTLLPKPFTLRELAIKVRQVIDHSK
jgi:PAS domain S-box-containing protein